VLVALRGLERDDLLARVHTASGAAGDAPPDPLDLDLDVAVEAVRQAAALMAEAEQ
jgi:hypothetical protein